MIDRDASVEATKENAQRSLGRPLTASEESAIETAIDSEVSSEQNLGCMSSLLAPFLVLCGVLWFFQKATEFAVELYMTFADPYVMWMIQPHTDSVLNMSLQIYLWIILPPILICLFAILFLPMLSGAVMFGISLLLGEIMKTGIGSGFFALISMFVALLLRMAAMIGVFVVPLLVLKKTGGGVARKCFGVLDRFHFGVKNSVFHLEKVPIGFWYIAIYLLIPAILIWLVVSFAPDKAHVRHSVHDSAMSPRTLSSFRPAEPYQQSARTILTSLFNGTDELKYHVIAMMKNFGFMNKEILARMAQKLTSSSKDAQSAWRLTYPTMILQLRTCGQELCWNSFR